MAVHCILCASTKNTVIRRKLRQGIQRDVLKCRSCSMVYLRPKALGDAYYSSKEYREKYGPTLGKASNAREIFEMYLPFQELIIKELNGVLKKNMKVLDVGCSAGQFLHALKGKVKTRVGLELSQDHATFIKKNLHFPVYTNPIEIEKIKEGPFDLVTSMQVLEHVPDPVAFLKDLGKHVKKGGYVYLELPNVLDVMVSEYKIPGYADFYYREPHLTYFSRKTLALALKKAGFKGRIKTVQRYSLLNHLHWIQTGLPQGDYRLGNIIPAPASGKNAKALNAYIKKADADYKKLIEKLGLGESLTFLGKKI